MGFTLKIYFLGLIAFVPSRDGKEATALLVDARDGYYASDGGQVEAHQPILLARAGSCRGPCRDDQKDAEIASFLFKHSVVLGGKPPGERLDLALSGQGAAWELDNVDLTIELDPVPGGAPSVPLTIAGRRPGADPGAATTLKSLPQNEAEIDNFSWVVEVGRLAADIGGVDRDVLARGPQKGLVVARLKLDRGSLKVMAITGDDAGARALAFETLRKSARTRMALPSQAVAYSVVAELEVPGCSVRLRRTPFGSNSGSEITLGPEDCGKGGVVEVAVLNLPPHSFQPHQHGAMDDDRFDRHFEMYYELAANRPPNRMRPVPVLPPPTKGSHPASPARRRDTPASPLLAALGLPEARGPYSQTMCGLAQLPPPEAE